MGSRLIFLSYAREDLSAVRDLYARLKSDGFRVWMDREDVLPGQLWEPAIHRAIQDSRVCVIALSPKALSKTGYVQKEMRTALEMTELMPEGRVFIIPVRLAPCDVPSRLKKWQWVDLFEDDGYGRLKQSLRKHLASPKTPPVAPSPFREPLNLAHNDASRTEQSEGRKAAARLPRKPKPTPVSVTSELDASTTVPPEQEISPPPQAEFSPREALPRPASESGKVEHVPVAAVSNPGAMVDGRLVEATLKNTTWHIRCRKCLQKSRWIKLRADGMFEFRFENDRDFRFDGEETWRVEANQLIISWRSGFSVERFTFNEPTQQTAFGTGSNVRGPLRITRLQ